MRFFSLRNRLLSFSLLVISVVLVIFSVKYGLASLYSYGLTQWHDSWQDNIAENLTPSTLDVAGQVTDGMLSYAPMHPYYLTLAAKQVEWRNFYQLVIDADNEDKSRFRLDNLNVAGEFYRHSAQRRLTWPNNYADLAHISWEKGEGSEAVMQWLGLAKAAAPHADSTMLAHIDLGLQLWPLLDSNERLVIADYTLSAVRSHLKPSVYKLLDHPSRHLRGCALLASIKRRPNVCRD